MKILILLLYYERPQMVENALHSIKNLEYEDWELAFIDDGSRKPGKPVVENILGDYPDRIRYYFTGSSIDDKNRQGGSNVGLLMNKAIRESNAEMAVMLCDDDALVSDYFNNLPCWAKENPDEHYCYSHVILFDPFKEKPHEGFKNSYLIRQVNHETLKWDRKKHWFNKTTLLYPEAKLDASQVAWRTYCNTKVHFPARRTCHIDSHFYKQMGEHYGQIKYSGFFGQYKGLHDDTLSIRDEAARHNRRGNLIYKVRDLDNTCNY